jgi:hypothetical protein
MDKKNEFLNILDMEEVNIELVVSLAKLNGLDVKTYILITGGGGVPSFNYKV